MSLFITKPLFFVTKALKTVTTIFCKSFNNNILYYLVTISDKNNRVYNVWYKGVL